MQLLWDPRPQLCNCRRWLKPGSPSGQEVPIDEWGIRLQEILVQVYGCSASPEDRNIPRVRGTQVCADKPERSRGDNKEVWKYFMVPKVCEHTFGEKNALYPSKERNLNLPRHRNLVGQNENKQVNWLENWTAKARSWSLVELVYTWRVKFMRSHSGGRMEMDEGLGSLSNERVYISANWLPLFGCEWPWFE